MYAFHVLILTKHCIIYSNGYYLHSTLSLRSGLPCSWQCPCKLGCILLWQIQVTKLGCIVSPDALCMSNGGWGSTSFPSPLKPPERMSKRPSTLPAEKQPPMSLGGRGCVSPLNSFHICIIITCLYFYSDPRQHSCYVIDTLWYVTVLYKVVENLHLYTWAISCTVVENNLQSGSGKSVQQACSIEHA